ncbi:uncharacterized protein PV06_00725 [Exophiala oligosperma]|nr:uncharacterized protein PV06_00725 [Exophiala oligosperma]KIW48106.1 hypothetical protein PV06_00725 [Exophiala oligosperma]
MTSSGAGYFGVSSAAYRFLRAMKLQLHPHIPMRINVVAPGYTESNKTKGMVSEFRGVGLPIQPPSAVGLAVAKLVVDASYHGHTLFVADDQYVEMEGHLGDDTARYFGSMNGDEKQFRELLAIMKAQMEKTRRAPA